MSKRIYYYYIMHCSFATITVHNDISATLSCVDNNSNIAYCDLGECH